MTLGINKFKRYVKRAAIQGDQTELKKIFSSLKNLNEILVIKEQKIFYEFGRKNRIDLIAKTYLRSVKKIKGIDLNKEKQYIDFVIITLNIINHLRGLIEEEFKKIKDFSFFDFLFFFTLELKKIEIFL